MPDEMVKIKCFDLKRLEKRQAIFLKTEENCYFITYFVPIVTLGSPDIATLIIKDFNGNKSQRGKKACFGKIIEHYDENPKVGECFSYATARDSVTTATVGEIKVGYFKDVEQLFLESIKKMLKTKDCPESLALVS